MTKGMTGAGGEGAASSSSSSNTKTEQNKMCDGWTLTMYEDIWTMMEEERRWLSKKNDDEECEIILKRKYMNDFYVYDVPEEKRR
jgi:hypothetical protein